MNNKIHIGIASPVSTAQLSHYFELTGKEPKGTEGATAPNLLIIELLHRGYTVSVFTFSREIKREYVLKGDKVTIYYLPQGVRPRHYILNLYWKERKYLRKKIQEVKPDVVHAHWQYEYAWAALDSGFKTIVTCRDSPVKVFLLDKNLYRLLRLVVAYIVLKKAKVITATSSYLANELLKLGVRREITVIPNFEPDWLFEAEMKQDKDLVRPKIIMINNGFDERKNVKVGIAAFQIFRQTFPLAELHLYGHGFEEGGEAFNWAANKNLNANVHYEGYRNFVDLMNELKTFTILVHPAREETFGNILTESMAVGVPVIGGVNSGSVPWVIGVQQDGGLLVDIDNADAIAQGMLNIINSSEIYENFSSKARQQAKVRFSATKVVDDYVCLYENVSFLPTDCNLR